ncbi:MAG: carbamoyltransferase HypF, partial [Gemmatimonadales bacterium]|nr:carbamoyltransferase HypF [Gemmatimonadales bacterium]
ARRAPAVPGAGPLAEARACLAAGGIVAAKGLGGFHLLCDATRADAVATLRARKGRGGKPFAVLVRDLGAARALADVGDSEAALLTSRERPIVLVRARAGAALAPAVAPGTGWLGLLLPYTPLHHLLAGDVPLVCTSGNRSEEPICRTDEEALERLADLADGFLLHDRPIHAVCDDSVVRVIAGRASPVRRSRGWVPLPVPMPGAPGGLLAVGGDLKAAACLVAQGQAVLGQHVGDMGSLETQHALEASVANLEVLLGQPVTAIACDRHPGYLGAQWAAAEAARRGVPLVRVQHHHAHLAALLAEQGGAMDSGIIALAFDGTGDGGDGTIWGGEVLFGDARACTRVAHLGLLPLPGGDAAIRHPRRTALAALHAAAVPWDEALAPVQATPAAERALLARQLERGTHVVPTSSAGRLLDAVAALVGGPQDVTFEGQAAVALEELADAADATRAYVVPLDDGAPAVLDPRPLLRAVADDVRAGVPAASVARGVHDALVAAGVAAARLARARGAPARVGLTGGVFQNVRLAEGMEAALAADGFEVLVHRRVPPNDGGLALGQAAVAAVQLADGASGRAGSPPPRAGARGSRA